MATFHTPMITLSDGNLIPQIGLGVLRIDDEGVTPVVESALEAGYRHIDGAAGYNNEAGVGRALKNAGFTQGEKSQKSVGDDEAARFGTGVRFRTQGVRPSA